MYSDIGIALMLTGLGYLWKLFGFAWLAKMYIVPLFWVNHWWVARGGGWWFCLVAGCGCG